MGLNLTGLPIDNQLLSRVDAPIGTYRDTDLDEVTFLQENLGQWLLCNGQSCVGTAYAAATSKNTVPDLVTNGEFRRQAKAGRSLGSPEEDAFQNITGDIQIYAPGFNTLGPQNGALSGIASGVSAGSSVAGRGVNIIYFDASNSPGARTAEETRPTNVACNVFIKVGH